MVSHKLISVYNSETMSNIDNPIPGSAHVLDSCSSSEATASERVSNIDLIVGLIHDIANACTKITMASGMFAYNIKYLLGLEAPLEQSHRKFFEALIKQLDDSTKHLVDMGEIFSFFRSESTKNNSQLGNAITSPFEQESIESVLTILQDFRKELYPSDNVINHSNIASVNDLFFSEIIFYLEVLENKFTILDSDFKGLDLSTPQSNDLVSHGHKLNNLLKTIKLALKLANEARGVEPIVERVEFSDVDITEVVRDVVNELSIQFFDSDPEFNILNELSNTTIFTNEKHLRIIIRNMIENAIKYGKGLPVTISLKHDDNGVTVSVTDQGIGLDVEGLKFFKKNPEARRQNNAKESGIEGTGIGLYFSRLLMQILGVELVVTSPGINEGSTFTIKIPSQKSAEI